MKYIFILLVLASCATSKPTQISPAVIKADSIYATREAKDFFNLGVASADAQDYSTALMNFTKALDISPNFASALYARGVVKVQLNQPESALKDLDRAGELGVAPALDLATKIRKRQTLNQMIINN